MRNKFTEEEKQFIRDNTIGNTSRKLAQLFNNKFKKTITAKDMYLFKKSNRLKSGVKTHFIKGKKPHNYKPIGAEFISSDGYTFIKVKDPNTWVHKQQYIYEKEFGKIPKNHSVIFADRNKNNFELSNLLLVKNKDKLVMKNRHLIFEDKNLTKTGLLIAQVINKTSEVRKKYE